MKTQHKKAVRELAKVIENLKEGQRQHDLPPMTLLPLQIEKLEEIYEIQIQGAGTGED